MVWGTSVTVRRRPRRSIPSNDWDRVARARRMVRGPGHRPRAARWGAAVRASRRAAREAMPSFGKTWYRWVPTVRGERKSRSPICLLVKPAAASSAISRCWGVSDPGPNGSNCPMERPVARSSLAAPLGRREVSDPVLGTHRSGDAGLACGLVVEVEAVAAVVDLRHPQAQELGELSVDAQVGLVAEGVGAVAGELGQVLVGRAVGPAVGDGHISHVIAPVGVTVPGPKSNEYTLHCTATVGGRDEARASTRQRPRTRPGRDREALAQGENAVSASCSEAGGGSDAWLKPRLRPPRRSLPCPVRCGRSCRRAVRGSPTSGSSQAEVVSVDVSCGAECDPLITERRGTGALEADLLTYRRLEGERQGVGTRPSTSDAVKVASA
jgi:hypothetical protein